MCRKYATQLFTEKIKGESDKISKSNHQFGGSAAKARIEKKYQGNPRLGELIVQMTVSLKTLII